MPYVTTNNQAPPPRLDPCLLGRPVHLLPRFAAQLQEDLSVLMRHAGRRHWGGCRIEALRFGSAAAGGDGRWIAYASSAGAVGFSIQREVLLNVLNYRYGRRNAPAAPAPDPATVRVTATEERLAVVLGQQLAAALIERVAANLAPAGQTAPPQAPLAVTPGRAPAPGSWIITIELSEPGSPAHGECQLALDQAVMARILQGLQPAGAPPRTPLARGPALGSSLQVRLDGRLVSKEITLAALFGLRVGDVIPVSLGRADVLLEDARLFRAAVLEHQGKLCLTSFEDAD